MRVNNQNVVYRDLRRSFLIPKLLGGGQLSVCEDGLVGEQAQENCKGLGSGANDDYFLHHANIFDSKTGLEVYTSTTTTTKNRSAFFCKKGLKKLACFTFFFPCAPPCF